MAGQIEGSRQQNSRALEEVYSEEYIRIALLHKGNPGRRCTGMKEEHVGGERRAVFGFNQGTSEDNGFEWISLTPQ